MPTGNRNSGLLRALMVGALVVWPCAGMAEQDKDADGTGMMRQGLDLFLRGLGEEVGPPLEELREQLSEIGPELRDSMARLGPMMSDLTEMVDDLRAYHAPEQLPNGDIIIRRKQPLPPVPVAPPSDTNNTGQIDL